MNDTIITENEDREIKRAVLHGLRLRCPRCGEGALLHSYLKVHDHCASCGQDFRPQRADDGPAYLTILLVGHVVGFALHFSYLAFRPEPLTLALTLSAVATATTLFTLPRMKGLVVAWQWAKQMHGF